MAIINGATQSLIKLSATYPKMTQWDIACIHTLVGYWSGGTAAHFTTDAKGTVRQHRDTIYRSEANYQGNHRVIAIENEDHGPAFGNWNTNDGKAVPAFTDAQCESLAWLLVQLHRVHDIPLELVPDSKPGRRGIAYHRQGISGNWSGYAYKGIVSGGEVWTKYPGKVCPGDRRIKQLIEVIIPRARVLAGLDKEVDMPLTDADVAKIFWGVKFDGDANLAQYIKNIGDLVKRLDAKVQSLETILKSTQK